MPRDAIAFERLPPGDADSSPENDRSAKLIADDFGQYGEQIPAIFVIAPLVARGVEVEVEPARARRQPDLAGCRLPADDELGAVSELDRHGAVGQSVVEFIRIEFLEPSRDTS